MKTTTTFAFPETGLAYVRKLEQAQGPCITCALATPNGGADSQAHRKRLDLALDRIEKDAPATMRNSPRFQAALEAGRRALGDRQSWSGSYEGACLHAWPEGSELQLLPRRVVELAGVHESRFLFAPTLPLLTRRADCLALHLSYKSPRLYRVRQGRAELAEDVELPESVYAFSEKEAHEVSAHAHVRSGAAPGGTPTLGRQGFTPRVSPRDLNEPVFLQEIARAIASLPEAREMPLTLIGDERIVGAYMQSHPPREQPCDKITNAPSHPTFADIENACRGIAEERAASWERSLLDAVAEADPTSERFTDNLKEAYEAAVRGRILFCAVAEDQSIWRRYSEQTRGLDVAEPWSPQAFETLDRIVVETLLKGGAAATFPAADIPGGKSVAAVLKW